MIVQYTVCNIKHKNNIFILQMVDFSVEEPVDVYNFESLFKQKTSTQNVQFKNELCDSNQEEKNRRIFNDSPTRMMKHLLKKLNKFSIK